MLVLGVGAQRSRFRVYGCCFVWAFSDYYKVPDFF